MKKIPRLYKLTSTGRIEEWDIWVNKNVIHIKHGQSDGKKQHITEIIKEGKNAGRSNATTPIEQAEAEAQSKWDKKRSKEYRESEAEVKKMGKNKIAEAGGYLPMLAHKYKDHGHKIKWPCFVQPKLDGLRCIATKKDKVQLWFRSGKPITTMGHIIQALDKIMKAGDIFDGELYSHDVDFNKICGAIRRDKHIREEDAKLITYNIYDAPRINGLKENVPFVERNKILTDRNLKYPLMAVATLHTMNEKEAMEWYGQFMRDGYEGIMFRNCDMPYEQKRSYNLLKYKQFEENEFPIIGYEEGKGQLQGHVGSFVCEMDNGNKFGVKLKGTGITDKLKEYFDNPKLFMGKLITVQYQGLTPDGMPRFPVGKVLRFDK